MRKADILSHNEKSAINWKEILSPEQFRVTREKRTESAYTVKYCDFDGVGDFLCICCGRLLFHSEDKFRGGYGWPTFREIANPANISVANDNSFSFGQPRREVTCSGCGAHLGFLYEDGPRTGRRTILHQFLRLEFCGQPKALIQLLIKGRDTPPQCVFS